MSTRKTTIATAEKRVIKAEIKSLQKRVIQNANDRNRERKSLWKTWDAARKKLAQFDLLSCNNFKRVSEPSIRRIAILEARLNS